MTHYATVTREEHKELRWFVDRGYLMGMPNWRTLGSYSVKLIIDDVLIAAQVAHAREMGLSRDTQLNRPGYEALMIDCMSADLCNRLFPKSVLGPMVPDEVAVSTVIIKDWPEDLVPPKLSSKVPWLVLHYDAYEELYADIAPMDGYAISYWSLEQAIRILKNAALVKNEETEG